MEYVITENQLKTILEQSKEPSMPVIVKLFKMLNEEKKKNTNNFCIDILFMIAKKCCIKENINWMPEIEVIITSESF